MLKIYGFMFRALGLVFKAKSFRFRAVVPNLF